MKKTIEENVSETTIKVKTSIKRHIFDLISAILIIAIIMAGLDAFNLRDITKNTLSILVVEWLPFLMAAFLLDSNLREKGKFVGKNTDNYRNTMLSYSSTVTALSGEQVRELSIFCEEANDEVLKAKQTSILKKEGIDYDWFINEHDEKIDGEIKKFPPLIFSRKEDLKKRFNDEQYKAIRKAKKAKIVGYKVNSLLGNYNKEDPTDLGPSETELERKRKISSVTGYVLWTFVMTLIGVKDILTWGWAGLIVIVFKVAYTFAKSYMAYFQGYNDVTVILGNHIVRKSDVLKEFLDWYNKRHSVVVQMSLLSDGNNLENI